MSQQSLADRIQEVLDKRNDRWINSFRQLPTSDDTNNAGEVEYLLYDLVSKVKGHPFLAQQAMTYIAWRKAADVTQVYAPAVKQAPDVKLPQPTQEQVYPKGHRAGD